MILSPIWCWLWHFLTFYQVSAWIWCLNVRSFLLCFCGSWTLKLSNNSHLHSLIHFQIYFWIQQSITSDSLHNTVIVLKRKRKKTHFIFWEQKSSKKSKSIESCSGLERLCLCGCFPLRGDALTPLWRQATPVFLHLRLFSSFWSTLVSFSKWGCKTLCTPDLYRTKSAV